MYSSTSKTFHLDIRDKTRNVSCCLCYYFYNADGKIYIILFLLLLLLVLLLLVVVIVAVGKIHSLSDVEFLTNAIFPYK
jgi:hypothetical protein